MADGSRNEPFVIQADESNGLKNTPTSPAGETAPPEGGAAPQPADAVTGEAEPESEPQHESELQPEPQPQPELAAETVPVHEHDGHRVVEDLEELAAKAERADEYLVLAQRTKADFENYRKRASREAALAQHRGVAKLAKELLPAIDNLDRALQAVGGAPAAGDADPAPADQLISGIKLVHADVLAALARVGIEPFSPAGEPFDPQYHEAVAQHPIEGTATGTVVEVYQQGYRMGETVLRPARVLVAA